MSQSTFAASKNAADLISVPSIEDTGTARKLSHWIKVWTARHVGRKRLLKIEDRLLMDIGISRAEALTEARKPFWVE